MMHLTSVLLPAPFSPSNACTLPRATFSDTSSSATKSPKRLVIDTTSTLSARGESAACGSIIETLLRPLFDDAELRRRADQAALGRTGDHHDQQRQDVGRGVEQVIALVDADPLQRGTERGGAAEQERGPEAGHGAPAREDPQPPRRDALPAGEAFVPAARIDQRQERAADARQESAHHGGAQPDGV